MTFPSHSLHTAGAVRVREHARRHHDWRSRSLNLCAAETITSNLVRELLASDFARRYATRTGAYSGARWSDEIEAACESSAGRLFGCEFANIEPISGHIAVLAALVALTQPGDAVLTTSPAAGGYPLQIAQRIGLTVHHFPLNPNELTIDVTAATDLIERVAPALVVFGASEFLFPVDLAALLPPCAAVGAITCYDGAHPLGLIAGGQFQDPLGDGVDLVVASTNKTFFGPHRGIVLIRSNEEMHARVTALLGAPPFFQSTHHVSTAVALAAAMEEMEHFGRDYAREVIDAARALAKALVENGVPVLGADNGYTESHQVLIDCGGYGSPAAIELQHRLEKGNILADIVVRFGTQQLVRLGMGADEMPAVARLIADVYHEARPLEAVRAEVADLTGAFRRVRFSFDGGDAFRYFELEESVTQ